MTQEVIDRIASLASDGIYEPGQYAARGDLDAGVITALPGGGRAFMVFTTVPNEDRRAFLVTIKEA